MNSQRTQSRKLIAVSDDISNRTLNCHCHDTRGCSYVIRAARAGTIRPHEESLAKLPSTPWVVAAWVVVVVLILVLGQ